MRRLYSAMAILAALSMLAPTMALADEKTTNPDGSIPKKWNLPKPTAEKLSGPRAEGGNGDGKNKISFADFSYGDMIVVGGTPTGHAGEWDFKEYNGSPNSLAFWSANKTPRNGVQRETTGKYHDYDYAYALWVPSVPRYKREAARTFCREQEGEPYNLASLKSDTSQWYCSKLLWASYKHVANVDLDASGGPFVSPADLLTDNDTSVFAKSD